MLFVEEYIHGTDGIYVHDTRKNTEPPPYVSHVFKTDHKTALEAKDGASDRRSCWKEVATL